MSFTIIDGAKAPAPMWKYQPLPDFKRSVDRVKYRELWHQRYLEGYAGLTGANIMYLQENHLKIIDGTVIRPDWREADTRYLFEPIEKARKANKSLMTVKRREIGLTSVGTFYAHYLARMNKGITCNITSDSQGHLYKLFMDKLLITQDNFHVDLRGSYDSRDGGSISKTKSKVGMTLAMLAKNEFGEEVVKTSDFFCNESSESDLAVSKFSSTRAYYTFIDEAALHKRIEDLLASLQPVMMKGTKQIGALWMGGSLEKSISQSALIKLKGLIDSRDTYNLDYTFIPGYAGLEEFTVNGWTDEKKGEEWILMRREFYDKDPNKKMLDSFIRSHPLNDKELFELGADGWWETRSLSILNQVKHDLEVKPYPISPVELSPMGTEIKVKVVSKSPVTILRHPVEGVKTVFGIDSVLSGKKSGDEKGSEFALAGIEQFNPVDLICEKNMEISYSHNVLYHERPDTIQGAYQVAVDVISYFNKFGTPENPMVKIMPEANAGTSDHFTTYMASIGLGHLLARRPDLSGLGNSDTSKIGVYMTTDTMEWGRRAINSWVQKYGYRLRMLEVVHDLIRLGSVNADIGSATLAAIVGMGLKYDAKPVPKPPPQPRWIRKIVNGNIIWVEERGGSSMDGLMLPGGPDPNNPDVPKFIEFMGIKSPVRKQ